MRIRALLRGLFAAALVAGAIGAAAVAQDEISPDHLALARKYVDMTDSAKIFEQAVVRTGIAATKTLISQSPDLADPVTQTAIEVMREYTQQKDALFNQFARIYAIHFTPEELNQIIAFYETEVGQRLLRQLPSINNELGLALRVYETNLSGEFMSRLRARLGQAGYVF
ncbi:MAG TPA: DUF2059 domain-containing protein [Devosiaceae bacterium]|nr:DUF2059 domain-containing protein [Devosiaceae bacterium]